MNLLKNFWTRLKEIKKETYIRNSFLVPILFVVFISISHTVTWYDIGNPLAWAMYLSVAIEVFALASISAASVHVSKGSIWFLFGIVTFIQMIGNIFFSFNDIDVTGQLFTSWVELIQPLFSDWDLIDHRRFLAAIQGGSLPIMSLTALHFYLQFNEKKIVETPVVIEEPVIVEEPTPEPKSEKKKDVIDPTDDNNNFWKGLVKPKPKPVEPTPPATEEEEDDMSKYNPQE